MRADARVLRFVLPGLLALMVLLEAPRATAAETCTGSLSGFQLLESGDEESGIGGTGIEERSPVKGERAHRGGDDDDSGIGGTGRSPRPDDDGDSGVGGTGIYGTVTRSDRLCVNGIEIVVPATLALEASSGDSGERALAVGQVVLVTATRTEDGLVAKRIVLADDYAGQIEVVAGGGRTLIVSGRRVRLAPDVARGEGVPKGPLRAGQWIVVHGQMDPNDTIVATRIEASHERKVRAGDTGGGRQIEAWLRERDDLEFVSIEAFVSGTPERPRVGGLAIDFGPQAGLRERLRPGAKVRVEGRLGPDRTLRIEPPPRPVDPRRPLGERPPPSVDESKPDTGTRATPTRGQDAPRSSQRPRDVKRGRPETGRPDVRPLPPPRPRIGRPPQDIRPQKIQR